MAQESYCTQVDLEARFTAERVAEVFSVATSSGETTGTADSTAVAAAITDACAWVGQFLIGIHQSQMPFGTIPPVVKMYACDATMFFGMRRRVEHRGKKPEETPFYFEFSMAQAGLKQVREGLLRIDKDLPPANTGGSVASSTPPTLKPHFFVPDPSTGTGGFNSGRF